jgi:hypothetical protein
MRVTNDFVFGTANYEWKSNVLQAGLRFDKMLLQSTRNCRRRVLLKRLINHTTVLMLRWVIKIWPMINVAFERGWI